MVNFILFATQIFKFAVANITSDFESEKFLHLLYYRLQVERLRKKIDTRVTQYHKN